jgi:hypothetical protein
VEYSGFESPLSDEQLKELGRFVVNCGFVEFLLGMHVGMLLNIAPAARVDLINPLAMQRKIEILRHGLSSIPKQETRALVTEACNLISPIMRYRNTMVHGIWAFDSSQADARSIAISTKERSGHLRAEEITKYADALAIATRKLMNAIRVDSSIAATDEPERLVVQLPE